MVKLLCIRHGQTEWNAEGRYTGQSDIPLNDVGRDAARDLADKLETTDVEAIYASDLIRAKETADIIAEQLQMDVVTDARLREVHQGEWEGMLFEDIKSKYAAERESRMQNPFEVAPPGGETLGELQERVVNAIKAIVARHRSGSRVILVAHGMVIAIARVYFDGWDVEKVWDAIPPNTEVIDISIASA